MTKLLIISVVLIVVALLVLSRNTTNKNDQSTVQLAAESRQNKIENVSYTAAIKMISEESDLQVVDIRTSAEYADGFLDKAINIDFYAADFQAQISELDQQKPILVYCRSGNRSAQALSLLQNLSFPTIYHLNKGIINQD